MVHALTWYQVTNSNYYFSTNDQLIQSNMVRSPYIYLFKMSRTRWRLWSSLINRPSKFQLLSHHQGWSRSLESCFLELPKTFNPKSFQSPKHSFDFIPKAEKPKAKKRTLSHPDWKKFAEFLCLLPKDWAKIGGWIWQVIFTGKTDHLYKLADN